MICSFGIVGANSGGPKQGIPEQFTHQRGDKQMIFWVIKIQSRSDGVKKIKVSERSNCFCA
jgi:hypothetical protein